MKLLKIIFIILLLVTFGEVGYYVYFLKQQTINQKETHPSITSQEIQINNTTLSFQPKSNTKDSTKEFNERKEMADKGVLVSGVIVDKFQSKIAGIDKNDGILDDFQYELKLSIKVGEGKVDFLLNGYGLKKVKVFKLIDEKEIEINLDELRVGDNIIIDRKLDSLKDIGLNVVEFKITKI